MRNFKRISLLLVMVMTTSLLLFACGGKSPTDVVDEYFTKVQKGDMDVEKLLETAKEEVKDEAVENNTLPEATQNKLIEKIKATTYKVNSETIDGDNAKVNVTVKGMDLNIVLGKAMQEAMGFVLTQAFSGIEMTQEETNTYMNGLLDKYLDEITYTDKTGDIELTKVDNQWKIKEGDTLSKLLLGIDSSTFDDSKDDTVATKEMTLNTPFLVETENGNYNLTIEGARATDQRNEFSEINATKVVFLDYNYENISFSKNDLHIDGYAFQVLDDEGNVLDTYPVSDENRKPKDTPVGGKCKASATFAVTTDSKNLNVTFTRGSQKVAKIIVPIS